MAYKTVVADAFFNQMIDALRVVEKRRGELAFAMLVPSFPDPRSWDLQVAAPWLEGIPAMKSRSDIRKIVEAALAAQASKLGFVRVRDLQSQLVQTLVPVFDVPELGTPYAVSSLEQTLFDLDEVIVLVARSKLLNLEPMELSA